MNTVGQIDVKINRYWIRNTIPAVSALHAEGLTAFLPQVLVLFELGMRAHTQHGINFNFKTRRRPASLTCAAASYHEFRYCFVG